MGRMIWNRHLLPRALFLALGKLDYSRHFIGPSMFTSIQLFLNRCWSPTEDRVVPDPNVYTPPPHQDDTMVLDISTETFDISTLRIRIPKVVSCSNGICTEFTVIGKNRRTPPVWLCEKHAAPFDEHKRIRPLYHKIIR